MDADGRNPGLAGVWFVHVCVPFPRPSQVVERRLLDAVLVAAPCVVAQLANQVRVRCSAVATCKETDTDAEIRVEAKCERLMHCRSSGRFAPSVRSALVRAPRGRVL